MTNCACVFCFFVIHLGNIRLSPLVFSDKIYWNENVYIMCIVIVLSNLKDYDSDE